MRCAYICSGGKGENGEVDECMRRYIEGWHELEDKEKVHVVIMMDSTCIEMKQYSKGNGKILEEAIYNMYACDPIPHQADPCE